MEEERMPLDNLSGCEEDSRYARRVGLGHMLVDMLSCGDFRFAYKQVARANWALSQVLRLSKNNGRLDKTVLEDTETLGRYEEMIDVLDGLVDYAFENWTDWEYEPELSRKEIEEPEEFKKHLDEFDERIKLVGQRGRSVDNANFGFLPPEKYSAMYG